MFDEFLRKSLEKKLLCFQDISIFLRALSPKSQFFAFFGIFCDIHISSKLYCFGSKFLPRMNLKFRSCHKNMKSDRWSVEELTNTAKYTKSISFFLNSIKFSEPIFKLNWNSCGQLCSKFTLL